MENACTVRYFFDVVNVFSKIYLSGCTKLLLVLLLEQQLLISVGLILAFADATEA